MSYYPHEPEDPLAVWKGIYFGLLLSFCIAVGVYGVTMLIVELLK